MILSPTDRNIAAAADVIRSGGVVAFPTETVYGLGANAFEDAAVRKVYEIKNRPLFNPLIVHIASLDQLDEVALLPREGLVHDRILKLRALWPGPLSIILPKHPSVSRIATGGKETVAVRMPDHPVALDFLRACGVPVAAPSANPFSAISPTCAEHVQESLGDSVSYILDGGPSRIGLESTIVSVDGPKVCILRPGGISRERLQELLGTSAVETASAPVEETSVMAPGMLSHHYSPRTPLKFFSEIPPSQYPPRTGLLSFRGVGPYGLSRRFQSVYVLSHEGNLDQVAANLFSALRQLDFLGLDLILVDSCVEEGIGAAIMDRLRRAHHQ